MSFLRLLVFGLLEVEDGLLGFDFSAEFFFCGEVEFVFAGEELLVAVKDGVAGDVFIGIGAEDDAESLIIAFERNTDTGKADLAEVRDNIATSISGGSIDTPIQLEP